MSPAFPLSRKLFFSHFIATFIASTVVGVVLYVNARDSVLDQLRNRLSNSAALISRDFDARLLGEIRTAADTERPEYQKTLANLRELRAANADIAFLYIMRLGEDGRVRFVVDSDSTDDQAEPGLEYNELNDQLLAGFEGLSADRELYTDDWGTFMSGYAPLPNGLGEFMVGMDMRADQVSDKLSQIRRTGLIGVAIALLLSWRIGLWMSMHFKKPIEALVEQCREIGSGNLDSRVDVHREDELSGLAGALNEMASDLKRSREENLRLAESLEKALEDESKKTN